MRAIERMVFRQIIMKGLRIFMYRQEMESKLDMTAKPCITAKPTTPRVAREIVRCDAPALANMTRVKGIHGAKANGVNSSQERRFLSGVPLPTAPSSDL